MYLSASDLLLIHLALNYAFSAANHEELYNGIASFNSTGVERIVKGIQWTPEAVEMLQQTYYSNTTTLCFNNVVSTFEMHIPHYLYI